MKPGYIAPPSDALIFSLSGESTREEDDLIVSRFDRDVIDFSGVGTLAGQLLDRGTPTQGTVRIYYRSNLPGAYSDRELVAEIETDIDGTWSLENINETFEYDIIGEIDGWFDRTLTKVKPAPMV